MSGMYGEKWNRPYGEWDEKNPTIAIWGAALRGVTADQVDIGLKAVADSGSAFIPTAPEFKEFCVGKKQHHEHLAIDKATREHNENMKRITHNKINREVGKKHIDIFFGRTS